MKTFEEWYDRPKSGVDRFGADLARITAKQLKSIVPEDREHVLAVLQDRTSLYSPYVADMIYKLLDEEN